MELVFDLQNNATLWVVDISNPYENKIFDFDGVEEQNRVETLVDLLDAVFLWIESKGYAMSTSEIVVFNLNEFCMFFGKQNEESLWNRGFVDYVSYFAGSLGVNSSEALSLLDKQVGGVNGQIRYVKLSGLFVTINLHVRAMRNFFKVNGLFK